MDTWWKIRFQLKSNLKSNWIWTLRFLHSIIYLAQNQKILNETRGAKLKIQLESNWILFKLWLLKYIWIFLLSSFVEFLSINQIFNFFHRIHNTLQVQRHFRLQRTRSSASSLDLNQFVGLNDCFGKAINALDQLMHACMLTEAAMVLVVVLISSCFILFL